MTAATARRKPEAGSEEQQAGMRAPLPEDEEARLRALHAYHILDTAPEQEYEDIVRLAARLTGSSKALITLIDAERQWFKARANHDVSQTPRDEAFCAHALVEEKELLVVPDALDDPRFSDNPLVQQEPAMRFYAGACLVTPGGRRLGTLCVLDERPRELTEEQLELLVVLSRHVVALLESRRVTRALADALALVAELRQEARQSREAAASVRGIVEGLVKEETVTPSTLINLGVRLGQREPPQLEAGVERFSALDLGTLHVESAASERYVFAGTGLAERRPRSRSPTCAFTLGYLQGLVGQVAGISSALGNEVACQSRGDAECRFVIRAREPLAAPQRRKLPTADAASDK